MSSNGKRKLQDTPSPSANKRYKHDEMLVDDDDVEALWAKIVEQERTELDRGATSASSSTAPAASALAFNDEESVDSIWAKIVAQEHAQTENSIPSTESDEELARRLQREWAHEQRPPARTSDENSDKAILEASASAQPQELDPKEAMLAFSNLFTQSRECVNCGAAVPSRRGFVSHCASIIHLRT